MVAQHGTELLQAGFDFFIAVLDHDEAAVGFDVGGDASRAHVGLVAQNAVAHIVEVGDLNVVKEDDVLQLHGVAHHAVFAHQCGAPDEGAVADLGVRADDAGGTEIGGGEDRGGLVDPDGGGDFREVLAQSGAEREDQLLNALEGLPGVFVARQIIGGDGVSQIVKVTGFEHIDCTPFSGRRPGIL